MYRIRSFNFGQMSPKSFFYHLSIPMKFTLLFAQFQFRVSDHTAYLLKMIFLPKFPQKKPHLFYSIIF